MKELITWLEKQIKEKNIELSNLDTDIDAEDYSYVKGYIYAYLNTLAKIRKRENKK